MSILIVYWNKSESDYQSLDGYACISKVIIQRFFLRPLQLLVKRLDQPVAHNLDLMGSEKLFHSLVDKNAGYDLLKWSVGYEN